MKSRFNRLGTLTVLSMAVAFAAGIAARKSEGWAYVIFGSLITLQTISMIAAWSSLYSLMETYRDSYNDMQRVAATYKRRAGE